MRKHYSLYLHICVFHSPNPLFFSALKFEFFYFIFYYYYFNNLSINRITIFFLADVASNQIPNEI